MKKIKLYNSQSNVKCKVELIVATGPMSRQQSGVLRAIDLSVDRKPSREKVTYCKSSQYQFKKIIKMTVKIEETGIGHRKRKYIISFPNVLRKSNEAMREQKRKKVIKQ